jgi:hypothetical protein
MLKHDVFPGGPTRAASGTKGPLCQQGFAGTLRKVSKPTLEIVRCGQTRQELGKKSHRKNRVEGS